MEALRNFFHRVGDSFVGGDEPGNQRENENSECDIDYEKYKW